MLVTVCFQLFEKQLKLSTTENTIELSDILEDAEEEFENEVKLLVTSSTSRGHEVCSKRIFPILEKECYVLDNHRKIPVPPPELV